MQHTFFVHFFAVVLHDYNFQERLSYTFYGGNVRQNSTFSCSLFFHRRSFSPCIFAAYISHFVTTRRE